MARTKVYQAVVYDADNTLDQGFLDKYQFEWDDSPDNPGGPVWIAYTVNPSVVATLVQELRDLGEYTVTLFPYVPDPVPVMIDITGADEQDTEIVMNALDDLFARLNGNITVRPFTPQDAPRLGNIAQVVTWKGDKS